MHDARREAPRPRPGRAVLAVVAVLLLATAHAPAAFAAAAKTPGPELQVEVWPDHQDGKSTFIVLAKLPAGAKLPAEVLLPLPEGSQLTWSGEINAGSDSGDTTVPATPVALPGGGSAIRIKATKSRLVQYEAVIGPVTREDGRVTTKLAWVQSVPASSVTFSSRVPIDATDVVLSPVAAGDPESDPALGQKLYAAQPQTPGLGGTIPFSVAYTLVDGGKQSGTAAAGAAGAAQVWPWFLALVAAIVVAMGLGVWSSKRRRDAE